MPIKGKIYEHAKICSLHFKPEDYDPDKGHLLKNAIPVYLSHSCYCASTVDKVINYIINHYRVVYAMKA